MVATEDFSWDKGGRLVTANTVEHLLCSQDNSKYFRCANIFCFLRQLLLLSTFLYMKKLRHRKIK